MSEIEKRQLDGDGTVSDGDGAASFERLIKNYSPLKIPPMSNNQPSAHGGDDLNYQDKILRQRNTPGNINEESKVTTVYDARPINAIDFTRPFSSTTPLDTTPFNFSFTVPPGITAIIRHFSFSYFGQGIESIDQFGQELGLGLGSAASLFSFSLSVDGIWQPNYSNLTMGQFVFKEPCYILAGENSVVSARFNSGGLVTGNVYLILYGQYLISSGKSLNHEPGNAVKATPTPPTPPTPIAIDPNISLYERYVAGLKKLGRHGAGIPSFQSFLANFPYWKGKYGSVQNFISSHME